ncbi:hypothetical protein HS088_TW21G00677 [Tripterygium wilfordii]|uniref:FAS1 domain-containing protein n=1 Tax=Tripterygium wilfordii TaxID=458696 RepID=A0A7J7C2Z9_TRIWF|nr:hypothetical protein HS088_TW21G00677 [Tripterygium wilfordii]
MQAAVGDMRAQSFYGFAVILQMYLNSNSSTQHQIFNEEESLTFFMPVDRELSKFTLSPEHLEDFLLSHSMTMTLQFSDLIHFPTGTIVPSGLHDRLIKIQNHGKSNFYVNDAQVITPNVCINSMMIKCHGIDSVIKYENDDYPNNRRIDRAPAAAGTVRAPPKT